jgi:hypothetical protein
VKLATQVLSTSVAIALEESGDADVLTTAKFCKMMNDFFDCTSHTPPKMMSDSAG